VNKILHSSLTILKALVILILLAIAVIWIWSSILLNQSFTPKATTFSVAENANIVEGERLVNILGCNGCHGNEMQGHDMVNSLLIGKIVAPALPTLVQRYTDQELEAVIRQGISPDSHGLLIMPTSFFSGLRDQDLSNIIAYIRQTTVPNENSEKSWFGPLARVLLVVGQFQTEPTKTANPQFPERTNDNVFLEGGYVANLKCAECHGRDLNGDTIMDDVMPSLVVVKGYNLADFSRLMREGIGLGDRELGLMTEMSLTHFAYLSDAEIEDLHHYLQFHPQWQ
jgi:cytochrome c553